jgi:hypothetical protein
MYRDVRAGPIMPYNNLDAHELFGKTSLGIQIAPEVALGDSGHERPGPGTMARLAPSGIAATEEGR